MEHHGILHFYRLVASFLKFKQFNLEHEQERTVLVHELLQYYCCSDELSGS